MNITQAIEAIKSGKKTRRTCWINNKFLYYVPEAKYPAMTDAAKFIMDNEGNVAYKEYIAEFNHDKVWFYQPTQDDILADDWQIIN